MGSSSGGAADILTLAVLFQSQDQELGDGSGFLGIRVTPLLQGPEGIELSPDWTEGPSGLSVTQSLYCVVAEAVHPLSTLHPTSRRGTTAGVSDDPSSSMESCLGPWRHKALRPIMCFLEEPVGELTRAGIKTAATLPSFTVTRRPQAALASAGWPAGGRESSGFFWGP